MSEQQPPQQSDPQQPYPQPQTPYPQQPYPQPAYAQQPPPNYYVPPQKSNVLRNVLLILCAVAVLFIGGCAVTVGFLFKEVGESIDEGLSKDEPVVVAEGKAFQRDGFEVEKGWKVAPADFGDLTITGLEVALNEDEDTDGRTARFSFRFYDGKRVAAEADCYSNEMQPGESSAMECGSFDPDTTYDTIKVADTW
ncbi:hypothetical protein [Nocardioides ochotonae]|uniref:hypothetical protein n=1 Tax=Nocardioides ochotonae TaxID=2685869 RepID=UPI001409B1A7|nr:hypothetical protein [Nocardioides ochotonae]